MLVIKIVRADEVCEMGNGPTLEPQEAVVWYKMAENTAIKQIRKLGGVTGPGKHLEKGGLE